MSNKELEQRLVGVLKKLDNSSNEIIKTQGYTKEVKKIKILTELIREQVKG